MIPALAGLTIAYGVVAYSYEIENAGAHADKVLVVWPRTCGAAGDPLGTVDLALNPEWTSRMHEVDYEVVVKGKRHELLEPCAKTTRLYALPAGAFPLGARTSTADDVSLGQPEAGAPFAIVPALDAVDLKKRIDFFEKDPRVLRTPYRFPTSAAAKVKAVHDVLSVDAFDATSFAVVPVRAIYTYDDGKTETVPYAGADASAPTPPAAAPSAPEPAPPPKDLGTRWVVLAAAGGLVVGGLLAAYRKKREARPK
ncbi:MAG: hypothetical protein JWP87_3083 [Labilithrix sp.]|nr:hypothetical protein [Labilithrix sp.]